MADVWIYRMDRGGGVSRLYTYTHTHIYIYYIYYLIYHVGVLGHGISPGLIR